MQGGTSGDPDAGWTRAAIMRSLRLLIAADNMTQKENAKLEAQLAIARAMMRAGRSLAQGSASTLYATIAGCPSSRRICDVPLAADRVPIHDKSRGDTVA
ncbi:MAG: hypothetical protein EOR51_18375 [Mesorhizobium sp.]|nr:MAG: hypothetical protein EOR54_17230 [Mesorhizobium sp.]RWK78124.1 MAG: hypothetical protein EOR50_09990 [Mesorhizobium sp.]RWK80434.1 MAG: hypothetical protein EOR51_18375 [Mesorhizobium sp.]RWL03886.1 MAG: hypothetical protein EOR55_17600 [Mesorhizobium sp.]RWL14331.1 MAG: hypothetical protein EOR56_08720 [Mesorhizobium sp.]